MKRVIYPKTYPIEFSVEQREVLNEILKDLKECKKGHEPPQPEICSVCGQQKNRFYATSWILSDFSDIRGKIDMLEALLGHKELVIEHT